VSDKQYGHFVHGVSQFVFRFEADDFTGNFCANNPDWGRIYFLNGKSLGVFGFLCFIFVVYKGYLKVWMMVWLAYEKQPAPVCMSAGCFLCFSFAETPLS